MLTPAEDGEAALLLEAGTQKPGNVGPRRDFEDTTFHQFLVGGVGARRGFELAPEATVGEVFVESVRGASRHRGGNTQFGAFLLLAPLVVAAAQGDVEDAPRVAEETTPEDAARFYEGFDYVDVDVRGYRLRVRRTRPRGAREGR